MRSLTGLLAGSLPGTELAGARLDTCPLASPGPTVCRRVVDYPRRASGNNIYSSSSSSLSMPRPGSLPGLDLRPA